MANVLTKFEEEFGLTVNNEGKIVTNSVSVSEYYDKEHADVLKKIRGFIKLIPELGHGNFSESSYINQQGKRQPMFEMDRQGFSMLVNKFTGDEATLFTYRYTKAFEDMAEEIEQLQQDNKQLYTIATSDKEQSERLYEANKIKYSWKRLKPLLENCTYKDIEDEVYAIINFHANDVKKKDRADYNSHQEADKTRYKQIVRDRVYSILDGIYDNTRDGTLRTVVGDIKESVLSDKLETTNRSAGKLIKNLGKENKRLNEQVDRYRPIDLEDYYELDVHPFGHNYMYEYNEFANKWVKTKAYRKWIQNFPVEQLPFDTGIDWDRPIKMYLRYINKGKLDTQNLAKATIDYLFKHYNQADDNMIKHIDEATIGHCDSYADGKIYFAIRNV